MHVKSLDDLAPNKHAIVNSSPFLIPVFSSPYSILGLPPADHLQPINKLPLLDNYAALHIQNHDHFLFPFISSCPEISHSDHCLHYSSSHRHWKLWTPVFPDSQGVVTVQTFRHFSRHDPYFIYHLYLPLQHRKITEWRN